MKLSFKQQQFMELVEGNYPFEVGSNKKGPTIKGITNYNQTLYATLTLRSLLAKKLIEIVDGKILKRQ
ncbi:hypothetical protein KNT64_gp083 [Pseudomonas phage PspYZU05]|uniref:Uncharacterized protein n=1 Tax=Pseudomonas phage PspYZU05 TaxID=1983556 RepID=A0A2U7N2J4_9CAUD|nr:hypothetical protein KNT64_gp083 [Pseudomonas phage PspYZU05]ASD52035.1 hypothetical protein PspYZU05_83 [Pseudomonas phage PspYZU05]